MTGRKELETVVGGLLYKESRVGWVEWSEARLVKN